MSYFRIRSSIIPWDRQLNIIAKWELEKYEDALIVKNKYINVFRKLCLEIPEMWIEQVFEVEESDE